MWLAWPFLLAGVLFFARNPWMRIVGAIIVTFGLLFAILTTCYQPVVPDDRGTCAVLLGGLIIGVIVTAGVTWRFRRTRPVSFVVVLSVIATLLGAGCFGAIIGVLNGLLDRGPETRHVQRIVAVGRHRVEVRHWLPDAPPQRVFVNSKEQQQIARAVEKSGEAGAYLEIGVKPGCFGAAWISSYRLAEHLPDEKPDTLPSRPGS